MGEVGASNVAARLLALAASVVAALALAGAPAYAAAPAARIARIGATPAQQRLALVLPLEADVQGLARFARSVTTPGSPQYGHYESLAGLSARFGASARTRALVVRYLRAVGARRVGIDPTGLFADATMSAGLAERIFATPLAQFETARRQRFTAPTSPATVPAGLRGLVSAVVGLDTRPLGPSSAPRRAPRALFGAHQAQGQPTSASLRTGTPSGCPAGVSAGGIGGNTAGFTPNQYLSAYGFDGLRAAGFAGQGERVALIEIDGFNPSDITSFAHCFGLDVPSIQAFGIGVSRPLAPGGEATLDLEVLDAAAPDLKQVDVYETQANAANTLQALTVPLRNHPQVISASLGLCEPAVVNAVGVGGLRASEAALSMAAASGVTFLASSGDQGSADCAGPGGGSLHRLAVNYPASSPWVTGVGGTNLQLDANNQIVSQLVWNDTDVQPGSATGGGFSELFHRPYFQNGAVASPARSVPDVSMLADIAPGFAVFCTAARDCIGSGNSNPWLSVGGTSAATPLLAGGLAIVDQRLRMSKREDLGLVNPLLYDIGRSAALGAQAFSDVLMFGNDVGTFIAGNGQPLGCCTAQPGFDAASGWGSLDIGRFAPIAILLGPPQLRLTLPRHQRPVAHGKILATVSCAGACRMGAYAKVRIGQAKAFEVDSSVHILSGAGRETIALRFSKRQLRKLRAGLAHGRRITATIFGVAITGKATIQAQTRPRKLKIKA